MTTSNAVESNLQSRPEEATCAPRSLWGWSPPPRPATTRVERSLDRFMPRTGLELCLFYGLVVGLLLFAPHLPRRGELLVDGTAFLLAGSWCALNFWRCRHAHCVVTAGGWLPLAAFAFAEAVAGRTLMAGLEQPIFIAILVVGVAFEVVWARARGTNAIGARVC